MKKQPYLSAFLGFLLGLTGIAAGVKISDLPQVASPSTNTFIEIADMNAVTKSGKYLLTNKANATFAGITNALGIFTGDTSKAVSGAGTLVALPTDTTANWLASGITNSTLPGNATLNALTATNGVTAGTITSLASNVALKYDTARSIYTGGGSLMTIGSSGGGVTFNINNGDIFLPGMLQWQSSMSAGGANVDLVLRRDAANTLAQRNETNAQSSRIYTTYTDAANYERLGINTAAGSVTLAAESAGTGSADITLNLTPKGTGIVGVSGTLQSQSLSTTNLVFQKTRVIRQALTHAGGTVTLNMATNVPGYASLTLTGAVTFASSGLIDGSQYDLLFMSSGASNTITWGPEFRFVGFKPSYISATNSAGLATIGRLWAESLGTNLVCTYAEE